MRRSLSIKQTDFLVWETICDTLENSSTLKESFKSTQLDTKFKSDKEVKNDFWILNPIKTTKQFDRVPGTLYVEENLSSSSYLTPFINNVLPQISNMTDNEYKIKIIEALWSIIYSNKEADMYETNLMRRLSGLLYLDNKIMGDIKEKVKKKFS